MFAHERLEGLQEALLAHELSMPDSMIRVGNMTQMSGLEKVEALLNHPDPPTAIITCNDLMALGVIRAAQKRGLEIGKDLAVVGYDDIPQAEHSIPSLTTIHQPIYHIGSTICDMLIHILRGEEPEVRQKVIRPTLIIRESCGGHPISVSEKEVQRKREEGRAF
jgi:DNA-binding LacI/PurR family transcriptional regulator